MFTSYKFQNTDERIKVLKKKINEKIVKETRKIEKLMCKAINNEQTLIELVEKVARETNSVSIRKQDLN